MERTFSWKKYDRMARTLESLAYVVIVVGPIVGVEFILQGDLAARLSGVAMIFGSILISMYHMSFALLMDGIREALKPKDQDRQVEDV